MGALKMCCCSLNVACASAWSSQEESRPLPSESARLNSVNTRCFNGLLFSVESTTAHEVCNAGAGDGRAGKGAILHTPNAWKANLREIESKTLNTYLKQTCHR